MTLNRLDRRKMEELAILELASQGHNYRSISNQTGASLGKISSVLHSITEEARHEIQSRWFSQVVPLTIKLRLTQLEEMRRICWDIVRRSKDDRVVLQSIAQLNTLDSKYESILMSTEVIDRAISAQKSSLIAKEIDTINRQQQQKTDDSHTNGNTSHTSENGEGSNSDGASENTSSSHSTEDVESKGEPNNV